MALRQEVALMANWGKKMPAIVRKLVKVTSLAGCPSWMMVLLNNVLERPPANNILEVWPDMEVFFHGGVVTLIKNRIKKLLLMPISNTTKKLQCQWGFFCNTR
jgi:uncharacterized protein YhhL (DUF1145 family)